MKTPLASRVIGFASVLALLQSSALLAADKDVLNIGGCEILSSLEKEPSPGMFKSAINYFAGPDSDWQIGRIARGPDDEFYVMDRLEGQQFMSLWRMRDQMSKSQNKGDVQFDAQKANGIVPLKAMSAFPGISDDYEDAARKKIASVSWSHPETADGRNDVWVLELEVLTRGGLDSVPRKLFLKGTDCSALVPAGVREVGKTLSQKFAPGTNPLDKAESYPTIRRVLELAKRDGTLKLATNVPGDATGIRNPQGPMQGVVPKSDVEEGSAQGAPMIADVPSAEEMEAAAGRI